MADVKKIATRVSYGEALVELANEHDDFVVLDADLAAATQTGKFKAACPDRFFDVGIAESNLMGVAAGIATTGRVAFASTFAMFAAGRAFEQVRNSIGYPHLNVKIGATHAGISVGEDGATHQCCEDIALMRVIPGMTVIVPADDVEARAVTRAAYECDGPVYMRFARLASPVINDPETYKFELGKGIVMREGADVTIIACGLMVGEALEAAEQLAAEGIDYRGCLYGGFMLTPAGPKVLEFNARFGDPETQVVLPRLKNDLVEVMLACANCELDQIELDWRDEWAVAVVLTSAGYPGSYEKGKVIAGIEDAEAMENVTVYHAGTAVVDGQLVTNGGRVLAVTALGDTFENARNLAYEACEKIAFEGKTLRHDIGLRALRGRDAWDA